MVFRWVGVAAPAQRCFQGLCLGCAAAQRGTGGGPGARGLHLPGVSGTRPLIQSGSGRSEVAVMALPPSSIAGSHDAQVASDLLIGNPSGHRSTPLSAGRLRGCLLRPDFMVHRACSVGKCQNQVTYSYAIGMWQATLVYLGFPGARTRPPAWKWKEATSGAGHAEAKWQPDCPSARAWSHASRAAQ
jgi:hypothetical protein